MHRLVAAILTLVATATVHAAPADLRVYVVVVDGLHPSEVGPLTPTLSALRAEGTWYEHARAVMIAETLPNHVAMMTGVLPRRSGIVANDFIDGRMEEPELVEVPTLVTRLQTGCPAVSTATIQSKTYLYNVFRGGGIQEQADFHWNPFPVIPLSDHAPDAATMAAFLEWLVFQNPPTPHFAFVNLGDVDRSGHVDPTGNAGIPALRQAALIHTDTELRVLVETLKLLGAWESTVLILVSDHSMDWSLPLDFVSLAGVVGDAGTVVQNGGAEMVYLNVPLPGNVAAMAALIEAVPGVRTAVTAATDPSLADLGLDHPNTGHIVAFADDGRRFSDPSNTSNPIPGNHGHGVTQPSVLLVAGGHPDVAAATITGTPMLDPEMPEDPLGSYGNLNVAPTVDRLFGLASPPGTYDAPPLDEAFVGGSTPVLGPCTAGS